MSNTNFKLRLDHDVFEDNPELRVIPAFSKLTDRQMKYVMLVDWYKSPIRLMEREQRKHKAALLAGYKLEKDGTRPDMNMRNLIAGKVNTIEAALREMREIQHDDEKDIIEAFDTQVDEIVQFFKKPNKTIVELEKSVKLMGMLPEILKRRKEILEILNFREPEIVDVIEEKKSNDDIGFSILDEYNEEN